MTISELIAKLEEIRGKHGDIEVCYTYNDEGYILAGSQFVDDVCVETVRVRYRGDADYKNEKRVVLY